jgi:RNA polymerase sigma-70 factor (ECF subfamily)
MSSDFMNEEYRERRPDHSSLELSRLVSEAQRGDESAFEEIYERFAKRVFKYPLVGLGEYQAAEDATSEVFLGLVRNIAAFEWRGEGSFEAWLFRIAYNVVMSERRRRIRKPADLFERAEDIPLPENARSAEAEAIESDGLGELWARVAKMPEAYREVLSLRFLEGLSTEQTGAVMGRSAGAVRVLQHRALKALQRELKGLLV